MADTISSRYGTTYLLQRAKSSVPSFRYKPAGPTLSSKIQQGPTIVFQIDKNSPSNGFQGSTDSLYRSGNIVEQQIYDNHGSNNDLVSTKIKPFNNNPALPQTQRDVVGNNCYFNSSSHINGWNNIDNEQLNPLMIYRDALKQNLTTSTRTSSGTPRMHFGRSGGHWPHIKQTNTYSAANLLFIDGTVQTDDTAKYPKHNFGYPPMIRAQHSFTSSSQDLSNKTPNLTTKSLDSMTWSATDQLKYRPSLSQYSNRYERHAKDGFAYWPTDLTYKKPRCKPGTTGTYKRWLGLSDSILKL
ncbi:unnamed protein product [Rotaria sp. Silwood2]|nr:unnamed protein product [Rotaria sp. Silwood2]CAF2853151.1 unnamed protein product [Rotaria sp. Silwood2]CAF3939228.1 unnamed protein product [Rotaria sp. Silwood2]CAF4180978.1 unnamed protein product [Rotaria sp. Silwood2]